jgi:GntR family transcriptional regulator
MITIVLSNSSEKPLYLQIIEQVRKEIMDGEIVSGQPLPSIRALAADLSVSVITTKRAYDELEKEGLIEMIPGRGCFAAGNNELMRERRLKLLEEQIEGMLKQAAYLEIPFDELISMIKLLKEDLLSTTVDLEIM